MMIDPENPPEVGAEIMVGVSQAAMRTTLFPEQTVLASLGDFVEMIFLRNELVLPVQQGTVTAVAEGRAEVRITNLPVATQLTDIGHVRLTAEASMSLLTSLADHLIKHHGKTQDELLGSLTTSNNESTSRS